LSTRLALVVGPARSGTTLTRLLLDAHPDVGCPSEAGLPALMAHLARVWWLANAEETAAEAPDDPGTDRKDGDPPTRWQNPGEATDGDQRGPTNSVPAGLSRAAREWIVKTVQVPMSNYCARGGKTLYVDKSLDSVYHLGLVREVFPEVRMVLVFRHVMDTVASGIEASPWGFNAYGYGPYVQGSPGNSVAALASYWLDHVERALAWEKEHPEACYRVRYEDLVLSPAEAVAGIQRFLGVSEDVTVLTSAFDGEPPRGPGDYKVEYTTFVHTGSVGHGKRVPVSLLPPALLAALNEKLEVLGYDVLDGGWNAAERPVDGGGHGLWADRLTELMDAVRVTVPHTEVGPFAVVAEDHRALRWVVDPIAGSVEQGDGEVDGVLTGTAEDLVLMLTEEENLGVLLRSGRVRHIVADDDEASRRDLMRELNLLVGLLRDPDTDRRGRRFVS
jgi:protein-tyrosine sulfotransferase